MIYIVAGLPKEELLDVLPNIVALPSVGAKVNEYGISGSVCMYVHMYVYTQRNELCG